MLFFIFSFPLHSNFIQLLRSASFDFFRRQFKTLECVSDLKTKLWIKFRSKILFSRVWNLCRGKLWQTGLENWVSVWKRKDVKTLFESFLHNLGNHEDPQTIHSWDYQSKQLVREHLRQEIVRACDRENHENPQTTEPWRHSKWNWDFWGPLYQGIAKIQGSCLWHLEYLSMTTPLKLFFFK